MRYHIVPIIISNENEIVPIWDNRVSFIKDNYYGNHLKISDDSVHYEAKEAIFDVKTKTITLGEIVEVKSLDGARKIGEEIYYEYNHRCIKKSKIKEILFEDYSTVVYKGKKLDRCYRDFVINNVENFDENKLYCIKNYERSYLLENGNKVTDLCIKQFEE